MDTADIASGGRDAEGLGRVLVTGAAGFLGWHLSRELLQRGVTELICADNFVRGADDEAYRELCRDPRVRRADLDLADAQQVRGLPDDVETVFHLAALNGTQSFYERPFEVLDQSTLPTVRLLAKYGPRQTLRRWVYAGSSEAYAGAVSRFDWEVPTAEDVPLVIDDVGNPRWSYAASKLHGEVATVAAGRQFGTPYSILRYHNVYGPRMGDRHVIPDFIARARRGVFELHGHAETRAFMFVEDAVRATWRLALCPEANGEIVNVGSTDEISMLELAKTIMRQSGRQGPIALHEAPPGSVRRRSPNVEKLQSLLGFRCAFNLSEGLARTIEAAGDLAVPFAADVGEAS